MTPEVPLIYVKKFWSTYEPVSRSEWIDGPTGKKIEKLIPTGELREVDWVAYGPVGSAQLLLNVEKISRLSAVAPLEGRAAVNPAVQMAHARWNAIKPKYDAWKAGQKTPANGTPLAAWNGITGEQAELFKMHGVHSVEEIAGLTDTHRQRLGIPGLTDIIENAKRFLTAQDKSSVTRALEEKDRKIEELQAQMSELIEMVKEAQRKPAADPIAPKRRGRPPKVQQPEVTEAA